jgi:two-component system chemotaxis response regulator CheB
MVNRKIKVLVIDDSSLVRNMLKDILEGVNQLEVIGMAGDPYIAAKKISQELPDVITLDIEMPRMDGITFLKKLMKQHPIPVVVISSLTGDRSDLAMQALSLGASEVVDKPRLTKPSDIEEYKIRVCDAVLAAAMQGPQKFQPKKKQEIKTEATLKVEEQKPASFGKKIIAIGASTGGTELISEILKSLKKDLPPIVIVQHMPGEFTKAFAKRLKQESGLAVKEAVDGDVFQYGNVYIANGFCHMIVKEESNHYVCGLEGGELVNRHRPSVDVLFYSLAKTKAKNVMGILLTGMGKDGARGLLELKKMGAVCIAQDEKSSVVFGMPKEAINIQAADFVGNPAQIISWINNFA